MFNKKHKIGDCIAKLRKEKGWTQNKLAEKLQVSDKAISKWESNKGDPSIEFLPAIAELFDVTIDYIMTGKENEVLTLELVAKNDDVKNAERFIDKDYLDENGHCLLYYVYEYNSVQIFKNYKVNELMHNNYSLIDFGIDNYVYMSIVSDKLDKNFFLNLQIDSINQIGCNYYSDKLCNFITNNIYSPFVKDNILAMHKKDSINAKDEWQNVYKKLINFAVTHNNKKSSMSLLKLFGEINVNSIKSLNSITSGEFDRKWKQKEVEQNSKLCYQVHPNTNGFNYSTIYNYAVVNIEVNTIKSALLNKWYNFVKLANQLNKEINAPMLDEYEVKMSKMINDEKITEQDIRKESVIHNGIVCIRELINLDNYDLYLELIKLPVNEDEKTTVNYSNRKLNFGACLLEGYQNWTFDKDRIVFDWIKDKNKDIRFFKHALKYDKKNLDKTLTYFIKSRPNDYEIMELLLDNGALILKEWTDSENVTVVQQDIVSTQLLKNQIILLKKQIF